MTSIEKLKELTEKLPGAVTALIEQFTRLLNAIFELRIGNQSEEKPDKYNEVSISEFSLIYTVIMFDTTI